MAAGYSKRSLVDKLGIKPGYRLCIIAPPPDYATTLGELPAGVMQTNPLTAGCDFIQFFTQSRQELATAFPTLKQALVQNGMLWISWPKKSSGVATDLSEDVVRQIGLQNGLVDIKVCAIDETWSGLKFVIRKQDRR